MCKITKKSEIKTATGYKVAIKKEGKYYSPFTNALYEKNKEVGKPNRKFKPINDFWVNASNKKAQDYDKDIEGKTIIFVENDSNVEWLYETFVGLCQETVILRMGLGKIIYEGKWNGSPVLIGSKILSIEEIN